jgi:hypothetical protein
MESSLPIQFMNTFLVVEVEGVSNTFGRPSCHTKLRFSLGSLRIRLFSLKTIWSGKKWLGDPVRPGATGLCT